MKALGDGLVTAVHNVIYRKPLCRRGEQIPAACQASVRVRRVTMIDASATGSTMASSDSSSSPAPAALAAFLRGCERRGAVFAELQCGDAERGDIALAAALRAFRAVSYTHLDVYKRQARNRVRGSGYRPAACSCRRVPRRSRSARPPAAARTRPTGCRRSPALRRARRRPRPGRARRRSGPNAARAPARRAGAGTGAGSAASARSPAPAPAPALSLIHI